MKQFFEIDDRLRAIAADAERDAAPQFAEIDAIAAYNGEKVLSAFIRNQVSEPCFYGSTGYGYGDVGRDKLDRVYADIFGTEDALVRHNFVSGTHALSVALFGVLRTGDTLLAVTGKPYDTLEEVIGLTGTAGNGSLKDFGVHYAQVDLTPDGKPDLAAIEAAAKGTRVAYIQRSRGYSLRPALTTDDIRQIAEVVHRVSPETVVMVDNCYGEFVQRDEPTDVGADLIIGSLIKNPGGAIASTGGYIAGRKNLVEQCAYRLTCVGMGKEVGCTLGQNQEMFLGLFLAPEIVANAVKTATFAAAFFSRLGFACFPTPQETRGDIITVVQLGSAPLLTAFCQGVQKGAPVDAFVVPEPWDMPGYSDQVIMAAGAFHMGASIELSADAPLREPFAAWMQGGITYPSGRIGMQLAAQEMLERGLLKL